MDTDDKWTQIDAILLLWFTSKLIALLFVFSSTRNNRIVDTSEVAGEVVTNVEEELVDLAILDCGPEQPQPTESDQLDQLRDAESDEEAGTPAADSPELPGRRMWDSDEDICPSPTILRDQKKETSSYDLALHGTHQDIHQGRDQFTFPPQPLMHRRSKSLGDTGKDLSSIPLSFTHDNLVTANHLTTNNQEEDRLVRGAKLIVNAIQILLPSFNPSSGSTPHSRASLKAIAIALSPLLRSSPCSLHDNPTFHNHPTAFLSTPLPLPRPPIALRFED